MEYPRFASPSNTRRNCSGVFICRTDGVLAIGELTLAIQERSKFTTWRWRVADIRILANSEHRDYRECLSVGMAQNGSTCISSPQRSWDPLEQLERLNILTAFYRNKWRFFKSPGSLAKMLLPNDMRLSQGPQQLLYNIVLASIHTITMSYYYLNVPYRQPINLISHHWEVADQHHRRRSAEPVPCEVPRGGFLRGTPQE